MPRSSPQQADTRSQLQVLEVAQGAGHHGLSDPQHRHQDPLGTLGTEGARSEQEQAHQRRGQEL